MSQEATQRFEVFLDSISKEEKEIIIGKIQNDGAKVLMQCIRYYIKESKKVAIGYEDLKTIERIFFKT